jgi:hypothetical protein
MAEVRNTYVKARTSIRPFWVRVWELGSGVLAGLRTMLPSANRKVLPGHGKGDAAIADCALLQRAAL